MAVLKIFATDLWILGAGAEAGLDCGGGAGYLELRQRGDFDDL